MLMKFFKRNNKTPKYLYKIFLSSKGNIIKLWCFDFVNILYTCFEPLLIGHTIDNLIRKNYYALIDLIVLYLFDKIINCKNNIDDDIIYSNIEINFKKRYYEKALERNMSTSIIDSNIDLIDSPIEFIRCLFINYVNIIVSLLVSLCFMFNNFSPLTNSYVAILSPVVILIGVYFKKKQIPQLYNLYNIKEQERQKVGSRNTKTYIPFLSKLCLFNIKNSKIDSLGVLCIEIMELILLSGSLILFSKQDNITVGIVYSGIEYIFILFSVFETIPDLYYEYKDVSLCVDKIDI